ncbi:MAG: hypothetical protein WKF66_04135 [Pedobacter sp.]
MESYHRTVQSKGILILLFLFCSCVSLKTPKRDDLVRLNAPMVIGKYPISSDRIFKTQLGNDTIVTDTIWGHFTDSNLKNRSNLLRSTHMELQLVDNKHLKSILYKGEIPLETGVIKGRLRKGYFRTHNLSMTGVPPFYWTMDSSKMQIGTGKDGQLYIDSANETSGSILIIGASTGGFTTSRVVPALTQ